MVFWLVIIALAVLLFIGSRRKEAAKKAVSDREESRKKELLSRLKSIDKNLSKIRATLKDMGKEEENEEGLEEKNSTGTEAVKPAKEKTE